MDNKSIPMYGTLLGKRHLITRLVLQILLKTHRLLKNFIFGVMNKIENRICIKTKDVSNITGYSERHARNILNDIKVFYKKEKHQPVTIFDFASFMNIPLEQIKPYIV